MNTHLGPQSARCERKIAVLYGGQSDEHDVSLASGRDVAKTLLELGYRVLPLCLNREGLYFPEVRRFQTASVSDLSDTAMLFPEGCPESTMLEYLAAADYVIFPVFHGGPGEDGTLQRELELRNFDFVGCDSPSSAIAMSKLATARLLGQSGIATIPTIPLSIEQYFAEPRLVVSALLQHLELPVVIKPDNGGSSVGVTIAYTNAAVNEGLAAAFRCGPEVLLQPLVRGAEISIAVWSDSQEVWHASPGSLLHLPAEELAGFSYDHKYSDAGGWLEIPASLEAETLSRMQETAIAAVKALGCSSLARVDFFLLEDGRQVINEINTMPGLKRSSHFPRLAAAAGIDYESLLELLINNALKKSLSATL